MVVVVFVTVAPGPLFFKVAPGIFRLLAVLAVALSYPPHLVLGLVDTRFAFVVCYGRHNRTNQ